MLSEFDTFLTRANCMQRLIDELPTHIPMLENPSW
jgi:hypothetical protein